VPQPVPECLQPKKANAGLEVELKSVPARHIFGSLRSHGCLETVEIPYVSLVTIYNLYSGSMACGRLKTIVGVAALHGSKDHSVDFTFDTNVLLLLRMQIGFITFTVIKTLKQTDWQMRDRWETMVLSSMFKTSLLNTGNILQVFGMEHSRVVTHVGAAGHGLVGAMF